MIKDTDCIIQVLPALKQGGVERGTIEIATALKNKGIRNIVISSGGPMVSELKYLGVEHITLPVQTKNPFKIWLNSIRLARIFREKKATLIHVRSRAPAWSVKWACRKVKIPFITTYHGRYGLKPRWLKKTYNQVMLSGEKVIAVSDFVRQHLQTEYQVQPEHICLIPRGADTDRFDMQAIRLGDFNDFIRQHDIPQEKPIVSLVGRLSRIKGHTVLLDALKQMKHKNLTLLFVGGNPKGDYQTELNAKLKELPKTITVRMFSVSGNEIPMAYAVSTVCVQPSLIPETFGRSIAEAQAMKRIVVAADHGGACELIENGKTGFLTPVEDAKALALALDNVLDMSVEEQHKIGEDACHSVRTNYSIKSMCEKTIDLYQEILK